MTRESNILTRNNKQSCVATRFINRTLKRSVGTFSVVSFFFLLHFYGIFKMKFVFLIGLFLSAQSVSGERRTGAKDNFDVDISCKECDK